VLIWRKGQRFLVRSLVVPQLCMSLCLSSSSVYVVSCLRYRRLDKHILFMRCWLAFTSILGFFLFIFCFMRYHVADLEFLQTFSQAVLIWFVLYQLSYADVKWIAYSTYQRAFNVHWSSQRCLVE
jgi:hypothetical protein